MIRTTPLLNYQPVFEMPIETGHAVVPVAVELMAFSYSDLSEDVANEARAAAEQIQAHDRSHVRSAIEIGRTLLRMQGRLAHGHFLPWVTQHAGLSTSTAYRYMAVAKMIEARVADGKLPTVGNLTLRTLEALAAPGIPEDERSRIMFDLGSSTPPDDATIRKQITKAKASSPKPKPSKASQVAPAETMPDTERSADDQQLDSLFRLIGDCLRDHADRVLDVLAQVDPEQFVRRVREALEKAQDGVQAAQGIEASQESTTAAGGAPVASA